jgi:hypothetical protein
MPKKVEEMLEELGITKDHPEYQNKVSSLKNWSNEVFKTIEKDVKERKSADEKSGNTANAGSTGNTEVSNSGIDESTKKKLDEFDKIIEENQQLKKLAKDNEALEAVFEQKIKAVERDKENEMNEVKRKEDEKRRKEIESEKTLTSKYKQDLFNLMMKDEITKIGRRLKIDKPEYFADEVLMRGLAKVKEENLRDGTVKRIFSTIPITYKDIESNNIEKTEEFSENGFEKGIGLLLQSDDRIKSLYKIVDTTPVGSGANYGGNSPSGTDLMGKSSEEVQKMGETLTRQR